MNLKVKIFLCSIILFTFINTASGIIELGKTKAPDFSLFDLDKKIVRLSQKRFKNRIIILNFFVTWLPPCRLEIPGFVKLYKAYRSKGVFFLGICLDINDIDKIKEFVKKYKINYPVLIGSREVVVDYGGIEVIPTTFIINHNKIITDKIVGYANEEDLKKRINKLIKIRKNQEKEKEKKKK